MPKLFFFIEKLSIKDISEVLGVSSRSISKYLNAHKDYPEETNRRKEISAAKRKAFEKSSYRKEYKKSGIKKIGLMISSHQ